MNKLWDVIGVFLLASFQLIDILTRYGIMVAGPISYILIVVFIAAIAVSGWLEDVNV